MDIKYENVGLLMGIALSESYTITNDSYGEIIFVLPSRYLWEKCKTCLCLVCSKVSRTVYTMSLL